MMGHSPCLLVLNAAESLLQIVIARKESGPDGRDSLVPLCAESWHAPSQGAELLAPALRDALARLRLQATDIDRIGCVRGPGSFTGVRLALATAAGFSRATGALQAGLDYLPLLAQSAWALINAFIPGPAYIWALTHARRELVHLQGFEVRSDLAPIGEILVVTPFEAAEIIASNQSGGQGPALVLGSGLSRNRDVLEKAMAGNNKGSILLLPSFFDHPDAAALLRAAETAAFAQKDIEPLYVRPSDAEENLESIAASLGLDPAQARKKLDSLLAGQEE